MTMLWRIPENYPEELIGIFEKLSFDRFLLKQGRRITDHSATPVVRFSATLDQLKSYDCLPNSAQVPLVSARLAEALDALCSNDFQTVPARIITADGELSGFTFLNVTSCVSAIDHASSIYSFVPGTKQIMGFKRLRYTEGCLGMHHLALDAEYRQHLLASRAVHELLNRLNVKGVELKMAEEIQW